MWNVAYAIKSEYRRMGYAKETVLGLIAYINKIKPDSTIRARILEKNHSSIELVKSLGFRQVRDYGEKYLGQDLLYFIYQPRLSPINP